MYFAVESACGRIHRRQAASADRIGVLTAVKIAVGHFLKRFDSRATTSNKKENRTAKGHLLC